MNRHDLRHVVREEARRFASSEEEFKTLVAAGLKRLYQMKIPEHVHDPAAWTCIAIRKVYVRLLADNSQFGATNDSQQCN